MTTEHIKFIERSIELSKSAVEKGDHPFGALLVKDGQIILEAENSVNTEKDATRHAELNLVSQANRMFDRDTISQSILYTSTEPCAMCSGAIYWSGIRKVVYSCSTEKLGEIAGGELVISCSDIFHKGKEPVELIGPILEEISANIHQTFWK